MYRRRRVFRRRLYSQRQDCEASTCPAGYACRNGLCDPVDLCAGVNCGTDSFCRDGECIFSCADVSCPAASACFDGICQSTGCGPVGCDDAEACVDNLCVPDTCAETTCADGTICFQGECIIDPCSRVSCPPLQACAAIEGTAQCVADWPIVEVDEDESESNTEGSNPSDSMSADAGVNNGASNESGGSSDSTAGEMGGLVQPVQQEAMMIQGVQPIVDNPLMALVRVTSHAGTT